MNKPRAWLGAVAAITSVPALAQDFAAEDIHQSRAKISVDFFETVPATELPEEWFGHEGSDPNPRPVAAERFVRFSGTLQNEVFDPAATTPFEFSMRFMDGEERRVVIDSIVAVAGNATAMRHVTGHVKSDEYSHINLVLSEEQIRGTVHADDFVIEIRPVKDHISVIQRLYPDRFQKERKPVPAHRQHGFVVKDPPDLPLLVAAGDEFEGPQPFVNESYESESFVAPEIVVLVVRHDDQINCGPTDLDIASQTYQGALDHAFAGYATSLVVTRCTTQPEIWTDLEDARQYIMTDTVMMDWRADESADLVVILVQDGLGSCGYTQYPDYPLYPIDYYVDQYAHDAAFAVVDESCALGQFSLAHEVGHLMGMKHERFNELGGVNNYCGYGRPVTRGNQPVELTIMAYDDYCDYMGVTCQRKPYYSIPRKEATGIFGWLSNLLHKCFGKVKGITCASTDPGHLNRPASNTMQLIDAAPLVATYSDEL